MNILTELRGRFRLALESLVTDPADALAMIRQAQDPKFGDYQANCAMPLGKQLGRPPRQLAVEMVARLQSDDLCDPPEVAGPGFINLRLKTSWLAQQLGRMRRDERLAIPAVAMPSTYVVDFSSPNVAKPMHVGHIRSTVIGDSLSRTLRFLGHRVITDNHLGDWGTQFGMIIYGYKHFVDRAVYESHPVQELARLYKLVNQLVEYHEALSVVPRLEQSVADTEREAAQCRVSPRTAQDPRTGAAASGKGEGVDRKGADKIHAAALKKAEERLADARAALADAQRKIRAVEGQPELARLAAQHPEIADRILAETAKLHEGDPENRALWQSFLPACEEDIDRIYRRLDIRFDHAYGESFYHDRLAAVVEDLQRRGLARESDGATCVFLEGFETPMIIRKRDGAFLYATTDLATIQFRVETWHPHVLLYVVDHRQSEHFEKLFATARRWGYADVDLRHVSFGTVLGEDGRPYKTRSGDTVGLDSLLDEAVNRAYEVVCQNDDEKPGGAELSEVERRRVAEIIGHAAIKYADLSHNRTSDYVFSWDKMVALEGNTATYMQYSYARTQSIFSKGRIDLDSLRASSDPIALDHPMERALALALLRFGEALDEVLVDYRPNQLTTYLYELATQFSRFYQQCKVLEGESDAVRQSRLVLCDLTGRTLRTGLSLLGIGVVDRM
jgi:arginyl-tRNA synthetase